MTVSDLLTVIALVLIAVFVVIGRMDVWVGLLAALLALAIFCKGRV
jgi:uncharacterized membrane protein YkgB